MSKQGRLYRVVMVVRAPVETVVSNDALMAAVVGAFEPQATEVVSVDVDTVEGWELHPNHPDRFDERTD